MKQCFLGKTTLFHSKSSKRHCLECKFKTIFLPAAWPLQLHSFPLFMHDFLQYSPLFVSLSCLLITPNNTLIPSAACVLHYQLKIRALALLSRCKTGVKMPKQKCLVNVNNQSRGLRLTQENKCPRSFYQ
jgi:hypothetical protein